MLKNWTGMKMHVRVKVESGGNPSSMNPMGVQPYVNTGTTYSYCGGYINLKTGNGWNDYVLDLAHAAHHGQSVHGHRLRRQHPDRQRHGR